LPLSKLSFKPGVIVTEGVELAVQLVGPAGEGFALCGQLSKLRRRLALAGCFQLERLLQAAVLFREGRDLLPQLRELTLRAVESLLNARRLGRGQRRQPPLLFELLLQLLLPLDQLVALGPEPCLLGRLLVKLKLVLGCLVG
jgi:hypothetical protein